MHFHYTKLLSDNYKSKKHELGGGGGRGRFETDDPWFSNESTEKIVCLLFEWLFGGLLTSFMRCYHVTDEDVLVNFET